MFLAWWLLKEKITLTGGLGVLFVVAGVVLISFQAIKVEEFRLW